MKERMIAILVGFMMDRLSADDIKKWADMGLDILEDKIAASPSTTDDAVVLPMIKVLRKAFSIPDND